MPLRRHASALAGVSATGFSAGSFRMASKFLKAEDLLVKRFTLQPMKYSIAGMMTNNSTTSTNKPTKYLFVRCRIGVDATHHLGG
jgi:hypothetical protein